MKVVRRVARAAELVLRWVAHLAGRLLFGPERLAAVRDLVAWLRTTWLGVDLAEAGLPWFTFDCTRWLDRRLQSGQRVFEWGSGASTLWCLDRGCRVRSIEHDAGWHAQVLADAARRGLAPDLRLIEPAPEAAAGDPGRRWADYVAAIDGEADASLDLVVVDGRARAACFERARPKLAAGGLLLLDDSERPRYAACLAALPADGWQVTHFRGPRPASVWPVFSRTTVARRLPQGSA